MYYFFNPKIVYFQPQIFTTLFQKQNVRHKRLNIIFPTSIYSKGDFKPSRFLWWCTVDVYSEHTAHHHHCKIHPTSQKIFKRANTITRIVFLHIWTKQCGWFTFLVRWYQWHSIRLAIHWVAIWIVWCAISYHIVTSLVLRTKNERTFEVELSLLY